MAMLLSALLLLLAAGMLGNQYLVQRRRGRLVDRRLRGEADVDPRIGGWWQRVGDSRLGQRAVSLDSETQALLDRIGWRKASQRSQFAAWQVGTPLVVLVLAWSLQTMFFLPLQHEVVAPLCAMGLGYILPKRVLAWAAERRKQQVAREVSTFIPLLRILFESGLAVEQALRVLTTQSQSLLPVLTAELRTVLGRVDSGLELGEQLDYASRLLAVDEFTDTCVILRQLINQGGGAMKSLLSLKQLLDDRRLTTLQEYISKLSGKMSAVMMVFLFPALLIVLAGPGLMAISRAFGK
ncbi:membrane protein [Pseudomonas sp. M47T1]|uniref:type II secretion system F family protein n=1 Tax=Pseudomonas sp. M47T1 TaxID=1179778 RepID=UPI00026087FD|nr:type II secretion system F family protein [Pseudomonas sp. M47T1]EIK96546.1 membrane protein [Pseudomonas sp. M47T1]